MNTVFEKLGIYDIVAVLFSGISICTLSILTLHYLQIVSIDANLKISETFLFLVISYFTGLVFQELGSLFFSKLIFKNDKLLKRALNGPKQSHVFLTKIEKDGIYAYVKSKLGLDEDNDSVIYCYCKFYVINNCSTAQIDKDQSLSGMSRSLSIYFASLSVFFVFYPNNSMSWSFAFIAALLSVLLFFRCIRFTELRYVKIFRMFYYKVVVKY